MKRRSTYQRPSLIEGPLYAYIAVINVAVVALVALTLLVAP